MKNFFKNNKTSLLIIGFIILYFFFSFFIASGLTQNPNVQLEDFVVSEDGTEITLKLDTSIPSNTVRDFIPFESENVVFLDFYYTFGVSTFNLGAKDEFTIKLREECKGILFAREDEYELVLYKNSETGKWEIPQVEPEQKN